MEMALKNNLEIFPQAKVASVITGVGMWAPEHVVPNSYFAGDLDTSDQWIRERTGIEERRWDDQNLSASELAEPAARHAILAAGLTVDDIDGIVLATVTPDYIFPSTACVLQHRLGIKRGFAFDVNAVCSGFIYALVTANALIASAQCQNVLVVGTELYSRIINPKDRSTCVLFGDGAGAVVLSKADLKRHQLSSGGGVPGLMRGIYASELHSDGAMTDILCTPGRAAKGMTPEKVALGEHYLRMNGREVFKLAVRGLVEVSESVVQRAGMTVDDVDHFVSHQANARILSLVAKQLGLSEERVPTNVQKYGNTSAASLPILLAECVENGRLKQGDVVLLSAFGGGVTWGAVLLRW